MRFLKGLLLSVISIVLLCVITYFAGPKVQFNEVSPDLPNVDASLGQLDDYLVKKEAHILNLKAENNARIIWADSIRQTEYAIVYLHGFSAGPMEGAPLHMNVAKRYGMNLYLPRLSKHGIDDKDAFAQLTPEAMMNDAKEALVIGRKLGKKVILMSCSTGSTLGIYLSAYHSDIFTHIMYSPNIALFNPSGKLLSGPWGLQIAKKIIGEYKVPDKQEEVVADSIQAKFDQYWSGTYRVEGLVALQTLIDMTMTDEVFEMVTQPYFAGYYYKNDTLQDMTISVDAILDFDSETRTKTNLKRVIAFPDARAHVINSPLKSKEFYNVQQETFKFIENVLEITPVMRNN